MVLVQTKRVLERPWCILELLTSPHTSPHLPTSPTISHDLPRSPTISHDLRCILELLTALENNIPIVCVRPLGVAHEYDFGAARQLLGNFKEELEKLNPGAYEQIEKNWVGQASLDEIMQKLMTVIPNCISVRVDYSMSKRVLNAMLEDVVETVERATKLAFGSRAPSMSRAGTAVLTGPSLRVSWSNSSSELSNAAGTPPLGARSSKRVSVGSSQASQRSRGTSASAGSSLAPLDSTIAAIQAAQTMMAAKRGVSAP